MYYDDSSKRRNLLTGLVFGTLLGAGLALLFAPGEGVGEKARYVVRSARGLRRGGRRTRAYAHALRARIAEAAGEDAPPDDDAFEGDFAAEASFAYEAHDADDGDEAHGEDYGDGEADRPRRARRMAKRRFQL